MHVALMASENRAAHALGNNYPGGITAMVAAMNAKAKALGMTSAHFVDPTGLSSQNVASPEDLSKLVIAASKNRTIREFSTDKNYAVRVHKRLVEFRNTDNLVANPTWNIIVQKTGYIAEAGKCLVMAAVIEGRSVDHCAARFVRQVHPRGRCPAHQDVDGEHLQSALPGIDSLGSRPSMAREPR